MKATISIMATAIVLASGTPILAQDAARGEDLFQVCAACHSLTAGENIIGPSLAGVIGRPAADLADFEYSDAMKGSGLTWDEETLLLYIAEAQVLVPDTSMAFPGVGDAQDAADIVEFLATQ